ncbi:CUB domain protein [Cooperia oncophora]
MKALMNDLHCEFGFDWHRKWFQSSLRNSACCQGGHPKEDIPTHETKEPRGDGAYRCGRRIRASATTPTGYVMSPNYPIKYNKDVHCDWEIVARDGYKILLTMVKMEIEGEMSATTASCQKVGSLQAHCFL